ncbi:MAG: type IX secretion system sortase PorU [Bacteroidia bacterium]
MAKNYEINYSLMWQNQSNVERGDKFFSSFYTLKNGGINSRHFPVFYESIKIDNSSIIDIKIEPIQTETINKGQFQQADELDTKELFTWHIGFEAGEPRLVFSLLPAFISGNNVTIIKNFRLKFTTQNILNNQTISLQKNFKNNSAFAQGKWYKIATTNNGLHRIDYGLLKSMGIDADNIDPRNIQLWGKGAGMQPTPNDVQRVDDVVEIPIRIYGENDGRFNNNDLIVFYGESQINRFIFNSSNGTYRHETNLYADTVYYFLTIGSNPGKRVNVLPSEPNSNTNTNEQDYLFVYENERLNLIKSGKVWVGEEFDRVLTQQFNFNIPFFISSKPIRFSSSVTARSFVPSEFNITLNGTNAIRHIIPQVAANYDGPYTSGLVFQTTTLNLTNSNLTVQYTYNKPAPASVGWLDYFLIQAKSEIRNLNGNFIFRNAETIGSNNITQFNIVTPRNITVWDVTNPINPFEIIGNFSGNNFSLNAKTDSLRVFAAFDGSSYHVPRFAGQMSNQNLHGLPFADVVIVSPQQFMSQANRLAQHHREYYGLRVHVLDIINIYNEFSGGVQDITAVRDFLRMLYTRATTAADRPKYLVLFGRASYDYKNRIANNSNHVPTFQSYQSFVPTSSYCSDDFYGFLDDNEGRWDIGADVAELLDIGIGRLPVNNVEQAEIVVNKIINYTKQESFGDWRNRIAFVADDEDNNLHLRTANDLASNIMNNYKWLNTEKIFVDAYREVTVAGGKRNYDAQRAIVNSVERGCLIINYTGHGGEIGWSKKRILEMQDIKNWSNKNRLPLFVTATCEFSRFDDPSRQAAGEEVIINPNGGGVALFTTVRLVFAHSNEALNIKFYEFTGFDENSLKNPPHLGDIMRLTKNSYTDRNTRNFTLLGDPVMILAYPKQLVKTSAINQTPVNLFVDTLKALSKVTISGQVTDRNGNILTNYNGELYPTVFDKEKTFQTIGNNVTSPQVNFVLQNSIIYRGRATVNNGLFTYSFIMPKDINYNVGNGKISYYVKSETDDGTGFDNTILIGGTADSVNADSKGPEISLYLNDLKFVNGGLTDQNPVLIAKLFDENGINTTGQGVGRDIVSIVNNDNSRSVVLNDYFTADLDSYQSGSIRYNLRNLPPGNHTLKVRAFDVFNNPSEQNIEFIVADNQNLALKHVLNYPNPFTTNTTFHFDHNKPNETLDVMIQIFTVSGRLIKTLKTTVITTGNHFDKLEWNATDDFGDRLANGVYIYKVNVKPISGKAVSQIQKLVIFN